MSITIRKGTRQDLEAFVKLLREVRRGMAHKEWFYVDSPEELRAQMDSRIMELWLAMDGSRVAGALDLLIPGLRSCNYGYALGLPEEALMQVVNMDSAAVHPDYRGLGLQRKLLQAAEDWLGQEQPRILLCTVHPDNRFSLQNALAEGYGIQKQLPLYGSTRYLLRKDIEKIKK